ncbi:MAG: class I SAM-dependent methyltransferase [Spartobacteria bacterium]
MKLSHKIGKLLRPEGYARGWRRFQRRLHPIPLAPLLDKIDKQRLREIQERYATSARQISKYADVETWLKTNIERVQDLGLNRLPPQDIVDLGCGGGFFLHICQQLGHRGLGVDRGEFPLYDELIDLLGVERKLGEIKPFEPLPDLGRKFDWITAFSIGFNRKSDKSLWGPPEWEFFLNELEQRHLKPGGKIFLALNPQEEGGEFYTDALREFFKARRAIIERERLFFPHP